MLSLSRCLLIMMCSCIADSNSSENLVVETIVNMEQAHDSAIVGTINSTIRLNCITNMSDSPQIHWFKGGRRLSFPPRVDVINDKTTLLVSAANPAHSGLYSCRIKRFGVEAIEFSLNLIIKSRSPIPARLGNHSCEGIVQGSYCINDGVCTTNDTFIYCICPGGYWGRRCENYDASRQLNVKSHRIEGHRNDSLLAALVVIGIIILVVLFVLLAVASRILCIFINMKNCYDCASSYATSPGTPYAPAYHHLTPNHSLSESSTGLSVHKLHIKRPTHLGLPQYSTQKMVAGQPKSKRHYLINWLFSNSSSNIAKQDLCSPTISIRSDAKQFGRGRPRSVLNMKLSTHAVSPATSDSQVLHIGQKKKHSFFTSKPLLQSKRASIVLGSIGQGPPTSTIQGNRNFQSAGCLTVHKVECDV